MSSLIAIGRMSRSRPRAHTTTASQNYRKGVREWEGLMVKLVGTSLVHRHESLSFCHN